MGIMKRLVYILVAFAAVPTCFVGALGYMHAQKAIESVRIENLTGIADRKTQEIETFFSELKQEMLAVGRALDLASALRQLAGPAGHSLPTGQLQDSLRARLKILQPFCRFRNVAVCDATGRYRFALHPVADPGGRFGHGLPCTGKTSTDGFGAVQFAVRKAEGHRLVLLARRCCRFPEHGPSATVIFEYSLQPIARLMQETAGLGQTGETVLAMKTGQSAWFLHPLRHDPNPGLRRRAYLGQTDALPVQYALGGENGGGLSKDYRNQTVIAAWRHLPEYGWGLVAKMDAHEAFAPASTLKKSVIILVFVPMIMGLFVTVSVSRTITRPVMTLIEGVNVVGQGHLDHRVGTEANDEIGQLSRAFDQMTQNLRAITASRDQLNREVEKRIETERSLQRKTAELRHRVDELNCLFNLSKLVEQRGLPIDDILAGTVALIPPAFDRPAATGARITFASGVFATPGFRKTAWALTADITVHGMYKGALTVCTADPVPGPDPAPFLDEEAELIGVIAERLGKIIERKEAEQSLAESEKRFRDLVENSLTGISIVQNNRVVYQNREQQRLLGPLPRKSVVGDTETIHPDDLQRVRRFGRRLDAGNLSAGDIDFRCFPRSAAGGDQSMRWVQCRASLTEYQGQSAALVNIMDITPAKKMAHLLRIQDKMASLGRVAAGIAHEIRNPLSGINIYVDTLKKLHDRGAPEEKIDKIFAQIQSASGKIESVIRRVIDFSKPAEPKFEMIDINRPVEEALKLTAVTLRKGGIDTTPKLGSRLPESMADPQMIEEVILNLINNASDAMRHTSGEKKISVVTAVENDHIRIRVSDSGPGVNRRVRDSIFDPFFTTKPDGSGIGLSICHRIVADHKGTIEVRSSRWGGAAFVIQIPINRRRQSRDLLSHQHRR